LTVRHALGAVGRRVSGGRARRRFLDACGPRTPSLLLPPPRPSRPLAWADAVEDSAEEARALVGALVEGNGLELLFQVGARWAPASVL
jgi:hypothetical protein